MSDTIVCTAVRQAAAFAQITNGFSVALSLNLDCRKPEADPKAHFHAFLTALPGATFRVFRLEANPLPPPPDPLPYPTWPLKPTAWAATAEAASGATPIVGIINWLERRGSTDGNPAPQDFWLTDPGDDRTTLRWTELKATHFLGSSLCWPAPLPQDAGLVRLLSITSQTEVLPDDLLIVVPFLSGNPDDFKPENVSFEEGLLRFTYEAGGGFGNASAEIRLIDDAASKISNSLIDATNGFLITPPENEVADSERVALLLDRIQNRSASAFWAFPPLQAIAWSGNDNVGRLVWRAMNGLAALLDPVLLSLLMPQPELNRTAQVQQGPFLASLVACIPSVVKTVDTSNLAPFVRDRLQQQFCRIDESNDAQREAIVRLLADLLKIVIPTNLKDTITRESVNAATGILPLLVWAYAREAPDHLTDTWSQWASSRFQSLELTLSNELNGAAQALQSEDRIEGIVLRLFERTGLFDGAGTTGGELAKSPCTIPPIGDDNAKIAIASFKRFLAENFNGLDAVRHVQGRLFERHIVATAAFNTPGRWGEDDLGKVMRAGKWFARRINPPVAGAFDAIGKWLPLYAKDALPANDLISLTGGAAGDKGTLADDYAQVCDDLLAPDGSRRFVPLHAPEKLRLQIAVDNDADDYEHFAQAYRGICVLLRRAGESWSHCNLAELDFYDRHANDDLYKPVNDPADPNQGLISAMPLDPVLIDGQCRLFLEFDGHPFSSKAFVDTTANQTSNAAPASPYRFEDPARDTLDHFSFGAVPTLAYGETYEAAAFVVSKGGALPIALGARPRSPWLPSNNPHVPDPAGQTRYTRSYPYRRSTAVGRTGLEERVPPGSAKRIGVGIDDVQPLFRDYPRLGMSSSESGLAVLDILRNADGTGAAGLPAANESVIISLDNLWWWGAQDHAAGTLQLAFYGQSSPRPTGASGHTNRDDPLVPAFSVAFPSATVDTKLQIEVRAEADAQNVKLTFDVRVNGESTGPQSVSIAPLPSFWLRLTMVAADASRPISLSLADPAASLGASRTATSVSTESLLLLAPSRGNGAPEWKPPYTTGVIADVTLPRMGFSDLDRWLSNEDLFADAATLDRSTPPSAEDKQRLGDFFSVLMTAYIARNAHKNLGALLDRLPDLAVDRLLFEITPLDALYSEPRTVTSTFAPGNTNPLSQVVEVSTLGKRVRDLGGDASNLELIAANLLRLSNACSIRLQMASHDGDLLTISKAPFPDSDALITVKIPRGMVARLTIRPMVRASHLEGSTPVFNSEMASLATEKRNGYYIFEGVSLAIESMLGALASAAPSPWQDQIVEGRCHSWEDLVAGAVTVQSSGMARTYDLVANPSRIQKLPHGWRWRQLAKIDIDTQRWRFTGKPIYSWLNPTAGIDAAEPPRVAIEQHWTPQRGDIADFERQCFFDRDDADVDTQTMLLHPSGDTILQSFPWEQPSATYFRHRLWARSRYEGALQAGEIARQRAWGDDDSKEDPDAQHARSWIRVAMLADRTRLQLARPQLRALIPLTRSPSTVPGAIAAAAPVMAVLDERPFAHGGLADRILPEIRTGLGYVLPPEPGKLEIMDARKEFGPDPRLTYTPTSETDASSMTLVAEGPIGLTFDTDTVRNPAFANTALILHPLRMSKDGAGPSELEEHFLSVALRRFLDPNWLAGSLTTTRSIAESLWIGPISDASFKLGAVGSEVPLVSLSQDGEYWVVLFDPRQLDSPRVVDGTPKAEDGAADPIVQHNVLCRVHRDAAKEFVFLHSPLEKGRAALSVLAVPTTNAGDHALLAGSGNQPMVMASIEWQVLPGAVELEITGNSRPNISLTSSSPTTLMNWTRTGRNFDAWFASDGKTFSPHHFSMVSASRKAKSFVYVADTNGASREIHFVPERSQYPNPLHVQRHLAGIATKNAPGLGRPVEIFDSTFRLLGSDLPLLKEATSIRLVEFETPARPLVFAGHIDDFSKARFDLYSILRNGPFPSGLSLFMRLLGGEALNANLQALVFDLAFVLRDGAPEKKVRITVTNKNPALIWQALSLSVLISPTVASNGVAIYEGGSTEALVIPCDPPNATVSLKDVLALEVRPQSITSAVPGATEFWTDVSILTLPNTDGPQSPSDFTFDWFFTGGNPSSPVQAVTASGLQDMVETQARIIAVSPPVPIRD